MGVDEMDRKILAFERLWWRYAGSKEQAIRDELSLSAVAYFQRLNRLIDTSEALEADPVLVGRLLRLRDARQRQRAPRRVA